VEGSIQLNELLHDLRERRTRLIALAGKGDAFVADELLAEIADLSEELLVADGELLAQQEQLDATRAELEILSASVSAQGEKALPIVTTDAVGAIISATPAADALLYLAASRTTRPIATRFAVEDRPAIRTLISRVGKAAPGTEASTVAHMVRRDQAHLPIRVTATAFVDPDSGERRLTWLLDPVDAASGLGSAHVAAVSPDTRMLLDACYTLSAGLNRSAGVAQVAGSIARVAAEVGLCEATAVTVMVNPKQLTVEATTPAAGEAAESQFASRGGPAHKTMSDGEIRQFDARNPEGWPEHGRYLEALGFRRELVLPLNCRNVRATLSVYQGGDEPFGAEIIERLPLLARHAASVLAQADVETNLRVAVDSRQLVGQAVGILVERHRITPQAAFERLARASNVTQHKLRDIAVTLIETGEEPAIN
jgi:ANTAR domain